MLRHRSLRGKFLSASADDALRVTDPRFASNASVPARGAILAASARDLNHHPVRNGAVLRDDDDAVADEVERVVEILRLAGGRDDDAVAPRGRSCQ